MKKKYFLTILFLTVFLIDSFSQPFIDIINSSFQTFSAAYKTLPQNRNTTNNYFLNLFIPKELKKRTTLILRINGEIINSVISGNIDSSKRMAGIAIPLGIQLTSRGKRWKTVLMVIPKMGSDLQHSLNNKDIQIGGMFLMNYLPNDKVKIKAGLFYNHEAFGNFFIPLFGFDYRVNKRFNMYGVLPSSYKLEYAFIRNKLFCGLGFRSFTRSFRLSQQYNYDYVRYNEKQVKIFLDYFVHGKILVFGEVGYSIGDGPQRYRYNTRNIKVDYDQIYAPLQPHLIFNIGAAYRIRTDVEK